jgi:uncharacterized protein YhbP (UPF0306 family)
MDVEATIRDYIKNVLHMSLGTCVDNKPWVCEVHFVYDADLNLYFASDINRRHSQEIAQNPFVSGTIHEPHTIDMKPRGLYYEGTAEVMTDVTEGSPVFRLFDERFNFTLDKLPSAVANEGPKFYKITVSDWYVFDARESTPSQKYHWDRT